MTFFFFYFDLADYVKALLSLEVQLRILKYFACGIDCDFVLLTRKPSALNTASKNLKYIFKTFNKI